MLPVIDDEFQFYVNEEKFYKRLENLYWKKNSNWYLQFKKFDDEEFEEIDGYYGFYFISNYGQLISFHKRFPFVRKFQSASGYFVIRLSLFGKIRHYYIHDLVYVTFVGPLNHGGQVIHKNRIITVNYYKNFKWVKHSQAKELVKKKLIDLSLYNQIERESPHIPRNLVAVLQFDLEGRFVAEYPSIKAAGINSRTGFSEILACIKGRIKTTCGYQWRYKKDPAFKNGIHDIEAVKYDPAPNAQPVLQFDLKGNFTREFPTINEAARHVTCEASTICGCLVESYKTAGGFQWRYRDDPLFKNGIVNIKPVEPTVIPNAKAVLQFDLQGNFIKEYPTIMAAVRETGIQHHNICYCVGKKGKSAGGFQWRLSNDPLFVNGIVNIGPITRTKRETKREMKEVIQFTREGKFIKKYNCAYNAAQETGIRLRSIYMCLRGSTKTAGGFQWHYKSKIKKDSIPNKEVCDIAPVKVSSSKRKREVLQFDVKGNFTGKYPAVEEAGIRLNIDGSSIELCASGLKDTAGGFQWRYRDDRLFTDGIVNIPPLLSPAPLREKPVFQFDLEGNVIKEHSSVEAAARELGINYRWIAACVSGKTQSIGGFQWKYKNEPRFNNGVTPIEPVVFPDLDENEPVLQFDLEGRFIKEYEGIQPAAAEIGVPVFSLSRCLQGAAKVYGGYQWRYQKNLTGSKKEVGPYIGPIKGKISKKYAAIFQFSLEGKFIYEYPSLNDAAKKLGIRAGNIRACLTGHWKTTGGFQWRSARDPVFSKGIIDIPPPRFSHTIASDPVLQFDKDGNFMKEYPTVREAAAAVGITLESIRKCLKNKNKTAGGFKWWIRDPKRRALLQKPASDRGEKVGFSKPVVRFHRDGRYISEYSSLIEASKKTGVPNSIISSCALRNIPTAGGFQWRYWDDPAFKHGIQDIPPVKKAKPVLHFDLMGKFIAQYPSVAKAATAFGLSVQSILDCLNGRTRFAGNFQWRLKEDPIFHKGIVNIEPVKKINPYNFTPVLQFSPEGKFIRQYPDIKEAAKAVGISLSTLRWCLGGKALTAGGSQWRSIHDPEFKEGIINIAPVKRKVPSNSIPVVQFDLEGNRVNEFSTIRKAHQATGISSLTIARCARGKLKTAGGFVWRFK